MTLQLTSAQSRTLNELLRKGKLANAETAISEALAMLKERQAGKAKVHAEAKRAVAAGERQVREGRTAPFDAAAVARIKAKGRRLLAASERAARSAA